MRTIRLFLLFWFVISLLYCGETYAKRKEAITDLFKKKGVVRVYVADIKNSSGDEKISLKALKKEIEKTLAARVTQKSEIVGKTSDADILIYMDIIEYTWTDKDPIDMLAGVVGVVYDAVRRENYACMRVIVKVIDAKNDAELWKDRFKATITSSTMTEEESYDLMRERIAKAFIRKLFKKSKRK